MVISRRCHHCGGVMYFDTESQKVSLSKEDLDQLRLELAQQEREVAPEVDHGEGEEDPKDLK